MVTYIKYLLLTQLATSWLGRKRLAPVELEGSSMQTNPRRSLRLGYQHRSASRGAMWGHQWWIEVLPSGQIRRAHFVEYEHKITSMPIQSDMAEN
jgi:hypothetical protein